MAKQKLTKEEILDQMELIQDDIDFYELYEPQKESTIDKLYNRMDRLKIKLEEIENTK